MIVPPNALRASKALSDAVLNLSARELSSPEGVGFDLRLASVQLTTGRGSLREETRKTSSARPLQASDEGTYLLQPSHWYLATTVETMNLPVSLAGVIFPRSTLFRSGVALHTSVVPPGYRGSLTFGLTVANPEGFEIDVNARFCHLVLFEVRRGATKYRGQWNGGRLVQPTDEGQV